MWKLRPNSINVYKIDIKIDPFFFLLFLCLILVQYKSCIFLRERFNLSPNSDHDHSYRYICTISKITRSNVLFCISFRLLVVFTGAIPLLKFPYRYIMVCENTYFEYKLFLFCVPSIFLDHIRNPSLPVILLDFPISVAFLLHVSRLLPTFFEAYHFFLYKIFYLFRTILGYTA